MFGLRVRMWGSGCRIQGSGFRRKFLAAHTFGSKDRDKKSRKWDKAIGKVASAACTRTDASSTPPEPSPPSEKSPTNKKSSDRTALSRVRAQMCWVHPWTGSRGITGRDLSVVWLSHTAQLQETNSGRGLIALAKYLCLPPQIKTNQNIVNFWFSRVEIT